MITIYRNGRSAQVSAESAPVWVSKGWTTQDPSDVVAPRKLRTRAARTQPSDVTAPGESEIEGVEPTHVAQDEE